jgi:hypothetical protein
LAGRSSENLRLQGIDNLEKGKSVEIRITGADSSDSMLTHEDSSMCIVDEIAREVRDLCDDLPCNFGVPWRRDKDTESGRGQKSCHKLPCPRYVPRSAHNPWESCHAQELIKDIPGGEPGSGLTAPIFEPGETGGMKGRVFVSGVDQDVSVDDKHYRPSID